MEQLRDGVAVVTGGGRGLGRAIAIALAGEGMRVAVVSRSAVELNETVELIRAAGGRAISVPADVTDANAVRAMAGEVEAKLGAVDLLVNGAGIGGPFGPTWDLDPDAWWRNMEINVKGPMLCCHAVVPGMVQRRRGRIINIASGAGLVSLPNMSAYVTAKTALIRFTEVLADELCEHGVSVFSIQPGTVRTAMSEELAYSESGRKWLPWFRKIFEEGRDQPAEVASNLVLFLAKGSADTLSGRYFSAPGNHAAIVERADEVKSGKLNLLRMSFLK